MDGIRRCCAMCHQPFRADARNAWHQRYCTAPACRAASKAASQRQWLAKPENRDYFRGPEHVQRVQSWTSAERIKKDDRWTVAELAAAASQLAPPPKQS